MHIILLAVIEVIFIWSEISTLLVGKGNYVKEWKSLDLKNKVWKLVLYLGIISLFWQVRELFNK
jgi:hypothetical protein